jgi:hypothetical protein
MILYIINNFTCYILDIYSRVQFIDFNLFRIYKMNIKLPNRDDFLGSNFVTKMGTYLFAKVNNMIPVYTKDFPFHDSMYMKPFIELGDCKQIDNDNNNMKYIDIGNEHRSCQVQPVMKLKQDLFSYTKDTGISNNFYQILKKHATTRNYVLPESWGNYGKKIICIHLRLYDGRQHEGAIYHDYDGRHSAEYIRNMIHNGTFKYDMEEMKKYCKARGCNWGMLTHPDKQCAIDLNTLENMIKKFQQEYSTHDIHVVTNTTGRSSANNKYLDLLAKYNVSIHSNKDYDYDLWLQIHSDILVLSKSTYSMIAGYFHQGTKVYYPYWGTIASTGITTKYDKSGWIGYM